MIDTAKLFVEQNIKPLNTYPGRKGGAGVYQQILSNIPKCSLFIEAMCGSAILSSIIKGCDIVVNDLDFSVIDKLSSTAANVQFSNQHYKAVVKRYDNGNPNRVFYFDPPYLFDTRSYQLPIYKFDWNISDHELFLSTAITMKCPVMISHYPHKMYDEVLKGWRKVQYKAMTRARLRDENLYMNFPQPALLQHPEKVGENFTDRQRIKRKIARLVARLLKENPQERAAILTSVVQNFDYIAKTP